MTIPLPSILVLTSHQLGTHLVLARKHAKLTQSDVAIQLALSQNRVSHLERHPDEFSVAQLLAYCSAVGLEIRLAERDKAEEANTSEW